MRLRFLSTFRGNTEPIWFGVEERAPRRISFRAEQPAHLRVDVMPRSDAIDIQVYLNEQPHVRIELTREPSVGGQSERFFPDDGGRAAAAATTVAPR